MTTGKTIALTRQTSLGKVMSLLFNMLSRFVIIFFPRSKLLSISWLQSPSIRTSYTFYGLIFEIFIYEISKYKRKSGLFDFQNNLDNININKIFRAVHHLIFVLCAPVSKLFHLLSSEDTTPQSCML